jgi:hypothetical protein
VWEARRRNAPGLRQFRVDAAAQDLLP